MVFSIEPVPALILTKLQSPWLSNNFNRSAFSSAVSKG